MSWPVDNKNSTIAQDRLEIAKNLVNTDPATAQVHALIAIGETLIAMQQSRQEDDYRDEYGAV